MELSVFVKLFVARKLNRGVNEKNTKPEGLLDHLQFLTGCEYLSDLRSMDYERIREVLPKLEVKDYSLPQWLDAADYLTGSKSETDSIQCVREYLLHFNRQ